MVVPSSLLRLGRDKADDVAAAVLSGHVSVGGTQTRGIIMKAVRRHVGKMRGNGVRFDVSYNAAHSEITV